MSSPITERYYKRRRDRFREFVGKFNTFKTFVRRSPLPFENANQLIIGLTRLLVRLFTKSARSI